MSNLDHFLHYIDTLQDSFRLVIEMSRHDVARPCICNCRQLCLHQHAYRLVNLDVLLSDLLVVDLLSEHLDFLKHLVE